MVDKGEPGECGEACKTIEKAAVDIVGEHDTDIAETLFLVSFFSLEKHHYIFLRSAHSFYHSCHCQLSICLNHHAQRTQLITHFVLWNSIQGRKKKSDFQKWLCNELSDACKKSAPSLSAKNHTPYPAFKPRGDQQNMDKMLNEMESQGMKGQMWSREELMKQYMGDGEGTLCEK